MTLAQYLVSINKKAPNNDLGKIWLALFDYVENLTKKKFSSSTAYALDSPKPMITKLEKRLGLEFLSDNPGESKVCFAQSPEVRDAFKTFFTALDLVDYLYATLHSSASDRSCESFSKDDFSNLPLPTGAEQFWELVNLGKHLRQIQFSGGDKND